MVGVFYKVIENQTRRAAVAIKTPFATWSILYSNGECKGNISDYDFNMMFDSAWQRVV